MNETWESKKIEVSPIVPILLSSYVYSKSVHIKSMLDYQSDNGKPLLKRIPLYGPKGKPKPSFGSNP